jgi:hypothetical protein
MQNNSEVMRGIQDAGSRNHSSHRCDAWIVLLMPVSSSGRLFVAKRKEVVVHLRLCATGFSFLGGSLRARLFRHVQTSFIPKQEAPSNDKSSCPNQERRSPIPCPWTVSLYSLAALRLGLQSASRPITKGLWGLQLALLRAKADMGNTLPLMAKNCA